MIVANTRAELASARASVAGSVGVVPTMGALHQGHAALLRAARADNAAVIATVFVNPLQFGPDEDFDRYPRSLEADLEVCHEQGVDLVFAPSPAEMYPDGAPSVRIDAGPLGERLEGESRPGHFSGMLTVVAKLLHLTRPDRAYFGEKDFQQLVLIRRMVADLNLPVEILGVPIVRDTDGVALSSRNRYLSPELRQAARMIPEAVAAGAREAAVAPTPQAVRDATRAVLEREPLLRVDRIDLVDAESLTDLTDPTSPAGRLLVAAFAGTTRLIDNASVDVRSTTERV